MPQRIELNELSDVVEDLDYPASRDDVLAKYGDLVVGLADGTVTVNKILDDSGVETFETAGDLTSELYGFLPREAVGEPYQSEGEG